MTLAAFYLGGMWATAKRDAAIFVSYRFRPLTQVLGILFSLTTFYYVAKLVRPDAVGSRAHYFAFVVVGVAIVSVLAAAVTTSQVVRLELMQGNFERMLVSPLGPVGGVISLAVFPVAYSALVASSVLALTVGIFSIPLHAGGIPLALLVGGLAALAFASIGFLFVAALLAFKSAAGSTWVISGVALLGGAYFPIRLFPGWIHWASEVQPFTPAVDLLRHLLVGSRPLQAVWLELLKLGGFTAVSLPISVAIVWLAVHLSRRRGTITEY